MHLLADTIVLTSQGVPFIHAGQEFMRTKLGDENSYKSSDIINRLDWTRREKYDDVVTYFAALIEMRKEHPSFRFESKEMIQESITPIQLDDQVIAYEINNDEDTWKNIVVIHNANNHGVNIDLKGQYQVVVKDGKADIKGLETVENLVEVPALTSMVLYSTDVENTLDSKRCIATIIAIILAIIMVIYSFIRKRK